MMHTTYYYDVVCTISSGHGWSRWHHLLEIWSSGMIHEVQVW